MIVSIHVYGKGIEETNYVHGTKARIMYQEKEKSNKGKF